MSLQASPMVPIPPETARVAHAAFPKGTLCLQIRDTLGPLYADAQFAALFSPTGQPAEAPARLALVLILQFAENLSDRQAADAVRGRIDWKYALGLELTDPGFDASVLSEFRTRLVHGGAEALLLEPLLRQLEAHDLLKARGTQRTDSTHILAAIRTLNRLELVGETMRYALNCLAVAAPAWLQAPLHPAWGERYSHRVEHYRLPKAEAERQQLAAAIGADGFTLLRAAYAPEAPPTVREAPAVEVLRQMWVQQYDGPDDPPRWRQEPDVPPTAQLIHSPYDLDARSSLQHGCAGVGYKAHATETCDDDTPHVITPVETTPATTPDDHMLEPIHAALAEQALLPRDHLVDCGYTDSETLVKSAQDYGVHIVGPVAADPSWQAREGTGFDTSQFLVDWDQQVVTCPMGKQSISWHPHTSPQSGMRWEARFARKDCTPCPHRAQCTRAKKEPRIVGLQAREQYEALQAARQYQTTAAFKEHYAMRAGVESTLSQGVRAFDLRRSRYLGLAKTHLQHMLIAVGINLKRVMAWVSHPQPTQPYISPFAALISSG